MSNSKHCTLPELADRVALRLVATYNQTAEKVQNATISGVVSELAGVREIKGWTRFAATVRKCMRGYQ